MIVVTRIIAQVRGPSMQSTITIGLDLAKDVFQVHGVDAAGGVTIRRSLRRRDVLAFFQKLPACLVGMEACGTSHYWARELIKLGHKVKQMPAEYVKAYRQRGKTDAADAAAICEAVTRPRIKEVATKTIEQQTLGMPHKARDLLVGQRTALGNSIRGQMAEFGIVATADAAGLQALLAIVADDARGELAREQRLALMSLAAVLAEIEASIERLDAMLQAHAKSNETVRRLKTVPGIGPVLSSAAVAFVTNAKAFSSGRAFAASLGLTPRLNGTGGEVTLGPITKAGNSYLRRLLYLGAVAVLGRAKRFPDQADPRHLKLLADKASFKVAAIALANRMARIIWVLMTRGGIYLDNHRPARVAAAA